MDSKYQDDENGNDHDNKKTDCMVKREPEPDITSKSYNNNRSAFEEDECNGLQNSGNVNLKTSHERYVQIKQEHTDQNSLNVHEGAVAYSTSHPDYKTENEIQLVPDVKEEQYIDVAIKDESHYHAQIKQEPSNREINKDLEELYADHEVKDEMTVSSAVLQRSGPSHVINTYSTSHPDYKTENEIQLVSDVKEEQYIDVAVKDESHYHAQIKQEPSNREINKDLEELYANHEVKDEMTVSSVVLQRSGPSHVINNFNQMFLRAYKKKLTTYICKICNREYKNEGALENHLKNHPLKTEQKRDKIGVDESFVCDCGQLFRNKFISDWHKRYHCKTKKHDSNLVTCDLCKKTLDVRAFKQHLKRHMTRQATHCETQPYYACDCGKTYNRKYRLDAHEKEDCEGACATKVIICHVCDKLFKNPLRLKQHKCDVNDV